MALTQAELDQIRDAVWGKAVSRVPGAPTTILQDTVDGNTASFAAKSKLDTISTPTIDYEALAQRLYALQQSHGGISDIDVDRITDSVLDRMSVRLAQ